MKNQVIRSFAMAGLIFMLAGASLRAQTSSEIQVNIPFDFGAGTTRLKAGDFTVKRISDHAVAVRSADGKTILINAPLTVDAKDSKPGRRLIFNRYGDQYFLSQVWLRDDTGRQLFVSNEEMKAAKAFRLARNNALPARVEVALRIK